MGLPLEKLPDFPESMNREWALAYTGVADATLKQYERLGIVRFRAVGPRGAMMARKADLQRMINLIYELGDDLPASEDMDI